MIEAKGRGAVVTFDGQTVTITRKGIGRLTVGKGSKAIPVHQITGVQWKQPGALVNGFIAFTVPGGNERRSSFGRQTVDAAHDENSVVFDKRQVKAFEDLRDAVQATIVAPAPGTSAPSSVADELAKLSQLRDAGVLSAEEFEAQKARLLG